MRQERIRGNICFPDRKLHANYEHAKASNVNLGKVCKDYRTRIMNAVDLIRKQISVINENAPAGGRQSPEQVKSMLRCILSELQSYEPKRKKKFFSQCPRLRRSDAGR